jgi:hypothetical protein
MQDDLFQTATSSQQDTPVSHLVLPDSNEARQMTVISGRKYLPLCKQSGPVGAFSRMFLDTSVWASTKCFLTWKVRPVMKSNHLLFQLAPSMPRTDEIESGSLLHTPTATANQMAPSMNSGWRQPPLWATPVARDHKGHTVTEKYPKGFTKSLANDVILWPTPTVQDSNKATKRWREDHQNNLTAAVFNPEKLWPTPAAANAKGAVKDRFMGSDTYKSNLDEAVRTKPTDGQLNADWVEHYMMGYPRGWTNLTTSHEQLKASKDGQHGSKG